MEPSWRDDHQPEILAAGLTSTDDRESALFESLSPGAYTAIVAGKNGTVGVGLVEAYISGRLEGASPRPEDFRLGCNSPARRGMLIKATQLL